MRRLLARAWDVDPRLGLLLALGAEQRHGQVARARRSDLNLEENSFRIRSRGKKKGATILLTTGQRAAVDRAMAGYLAVLEASLPDYPLFPKGQMPGGRSDKPVALVRPHGLGDPIDRSTIGDWFLEVEALESKLNPEHPIPHMKGRGPYGIRRIAVDGAKAQGISREGLQQHGGWTDTQVPDRIYADQEAVAAREEARDVRAKLRGEG
jgi:integrase